MKNANALSQVFVDAVRATGYVVYRYDDVEKKWVRMSKLTATSCTATGLTPGKTFKFGIKAYVNVNGKEVLSTNYPTVVSEVIRTAEVTGFKSTESTANSISLSWDKVAGAEGYVVYRYDDEAKEWKRVSKQKAETYTSTGLEAGKSYKFAVRSYFTYNGTETKCPTYPTLISSTTPATVNFTLTTKSNSVTLNWSKVDGATGYYLYYKDSSDGSWVRMGSTTGTTFTKTGLTAGKTYYFTVKAYRTVDGVTYNAKYTKKSIVVK